jgi:hypothetical protein
MGEGQREHAEGLTTGVTTKTALEGAIKAVSIDVDSGEPMVIH